MKRYLLSVIFLAFTFGGYSFAASNDKLPVGTYSYSQGGDELIDGSKASITWSIVVDGSGKAEVNISSLHAPYTCDGIYTITDKGNYFTLGLTDDENSLMDCDTPPPQFLLKKSSRGDVLVKSELFPWDSAGWKKMHKQ
ncbi:hypothetical protein WH357_18665 [Enterobacter ludwigii]